MLKILFSLLENVNSGVGYLCLAVILIQAVLSVLKYRIPLPKQVRDFILFLVESFDGVLPKFIVNYVVKELKTKRSPEAIALSLKKAADTRMIKKEAMRITENTWAIINMKEFNDSQKLFLINAQFENSEDTLKVFLKMPLDSEIQGKPIASAAGGGRRKRSTTPSPRGRSRSNSRTAAESKNTPTTPLPSGAFNVTVKKCSSTKVATGGQSHSPLSFATELLAKVTQRRNAVAGLDSENESDDEL